MLRKENRRRSVHGRCDRFSRNVCGSQILVHVDPSGSTGARVAESYGPLLPSGYPENYPASRPCRGERRRGAHRPAPLRTTHPRVLLAPLRRRCVDSLAMAARLKCPACGQGGPLVSHGMLPDGDPDPYNDPQYEPELMVPHFGGNRSITWEHIRPSRQILLTLLRRMRRAVRKLEEDLGIGPDDET